MLFLILIALGSTALGGCVSTQQYTYRNPITGAQAQCQKTIPGIVAGGFGPWDRDRILHAFAQECVDELGAQGFTERVWE